MPLEKKTLKACVMGWPVDHSLSPKLHGWWLKKYGIDGTYTTQAVTAQKLKDALCAMIDDDFSGCNLTVPLKEEALALMDMLDDSSVASGAVNTVVVKNGKLKGFDSDGFGFLENLNAKQPGWARDRVVMIGTGGASRSIITSLKNAGVKEFIFVNRTRGRAEAVAEAFDLRAQVFNWSERTEALKDASMLINCTSLGMVGQSALELPLDQLPTKAVVADLVYRPLMTPLLAAAAVRGNPIVDGMGMLIHQARLGFEKWFKHAPEATPELEAYMQKLAA
jgi:shikimate dehydrogenase